jgi:hypothetical protein
MHLLLKKRPAGILTKKQTKEINERDFKVLTQFVMHKVTEKNILTKCLGCYHSLLINLFLARLLYIIS